MTDNKEIILRISYLQRTAPNKILFNVTYENTFRKLILVT